jgi:hypothetical protein
MDKDNCFVDRGTEVGKAKPLAAEGVADMRVGVFVGLCCYEYELYWVLLALGKWNC